MNIAVSAIRTGHSSIEGYADLAHEVPAKGLLTHDLLRVVKRLHDLQFDGAEFAVGDDDEVAAAAGGVHEPDGAEPVPEPVE